MTIPIERRIVFGVTPEPNADGNITLLLGMPRPAWEYMEAGHSDTIDLSRLGLPIHLVFFAAASHDEAVAVIEAHNRRLGLITADQRRDDFSIKGAGDEDKPS